MDPLHASRAAILYNPVARGLARHAGQLQSSIAILKEQGIEARLVGTTGPGSAAEQVRRELKAGADLIIAAGGDGTINEVAEGLIGSQIPLAILPGGTANVLARELGLPVNIGRAAQSLAKLTPLRIAAGVLALDNAPQRHFLCMTGVGLDAEIITRINLDLKAALGKLAYYASGFGQVIRPLTPFEVLVDGKRFETTFVLASRVRNYGGDLEIARGASLLRDGFEVVIFHARSSWQYLPHFAAVAIKRLHQMKGCTILRARSLVFQVPGESRPVFAQLDGELAGKIPARLGIADGALTLLVPPEFALREQALIATPAYA